MFVNKPLVVRLVATCALISIIAACFVGPVLADSALRQGAQVMPGVISQVTPDAVSDPAPTAPPRPIIVKLEGVITAVIALPGEIAVDDTLVLVTADTAIVPSSYTPTEGDYVTVTATRDGMTLTATRIQIHQGSDVNPIEFRGVITQYPGAPYVGEWTIGGVRVDVDTRAVVEDSPAIGYYAQVAGWIRRNRTVLANRIQVLDPATVAAEFAFEGTIQEMTSGPGEWVVGGIRGEVNAETIIDGTPQVGDTVEVTGHSWRSSPVFEQIRVITEEEREVRLEGLIEEMHDAQGYWVIGQTQVDVDDTTFIDESRARAAVGMWAEVIARRKGPLLVALRIRIERPE